MPKHQLFTFHVHDPEAFHEATGRRFRDAVYAAPFEVVPGDDPLMPLELFGATLTPCSWAPFTRPLSATLLTALEAALPVHDQGEGRDDGARRCELAMRELDAWGQPPYPLAHRCTYARLAAHVAFGYAAPEEDFSRFIALRVGEETRREVADVYRMGSPFFAWGSLG